MSRVAAGNRKVCVRCGADVTFAQRNRDPKGQWICVACAAAGERKLPLGATSEEAPPNAPVMGGVELKSLAEAVSAANRRKKPDLHPEAPPRGDAAWIVPLAAGAVIAIAVATFLIYRPTWEDKHRDSLLAIKSDADTLASNHQPKEAYYRYKQIFDEIGDHTITDKLLSEDIENARSSMEREYAEAAPIIQKEEKEEQERQAEQKRQEELRVAQAKEEADRREREQREQEAARLAEIQRIEKQARAEAKVRQAQEQFRASAQYAALQHEAAAIVATLQIELITEDSAYRSMSERAKAARKLLAIYVKIQGRLHHIDISDSTDRLLASTDTELTGETSAIREIYENDEGFMDVLGAWCEVLASEQPDLPASFRRTAQSARLDSSTDDSAPRAICTFTNASMTVLQQIVASRGREARATTVVNSASLLNASEDSAWRASMHNRQAIMELLLAVFPPAARAKADGIRSSISLETDTEDSALRAQSQYIQGIVDALAALIQLP